MTNFIANMRYVNSSGPGALEMTRTRASHLASGSVVSPRAALESNTDMIDTAVRPQTMSFEQTLLKAFDKVNEYQQANSAMAERLITDPDSVDVHDVTSAMAKANLSLKITQTILDRLVKGWNEITTTR